MDDELEVEGTHSEFEIDTDDVVGGLHDTFDGDVIIVVEGVSFGGICNDTKEIGDRIVDGHDDVVEGMGGVFEACGFDDTVDDSMVGVSDGLKDGSLGYVTSEKTFVIVSKGSVDVGGIGDEFDGGV
ncbi:hypothetical protein BPOR_0047g00200 [Botrytis porri]|uniref:Uncharacterized protein n=1 Tax=Botrytis porri TaxID=87229 RepID=A0A4Z1L2J3_9HELO|nr:hypothetical protein BPOR_0047g00200 [Botrytis porri]